MLSPEEVRQILEDGKWGLMGLTRVLEHIVCCECPSFPKIGGWDEDQIAKYLDLRFRNATLNVLKDTYLKALARDTQSRRASFNIIARKGVFDKVFGTDFKNSDPVKNFNVPSIQKMYAITPESVEKKFKVCYGFWKAGILKEKPEFSEELPTVDQRELMISQLIIQPLLVSEDCFRFYFRRVRETDLFRDPRFENVILFRLETYDFYEDAGALFADSEYCLLEVLGEVPINEMNTYEIAENANRSKMKDIFLRVCREL